MESNINQMIWPKKIKWYLPKIAIMFGMLCLHMFDYVKDIGKIAFFKAFFFELPFADITAILHHFDVVVAQKAYTPYQVNFFCAP